MSTACQNADAPHPLGLLRAREQPRCRAEGEWLSRSPRAVTADFDLCAHACGHSAAPWGSQQRRRVPHGDQHGDPLLRLR